MHSQRSPCRRDDCLLHASGVRSPPSAGESSSRAQWRRSSDTHPRDPALHRGEGAATPATESSSLARQRHPPTGPVLPPRELAVEGEEQLALPCLVLHPSPGGKRPFPTPAGPRPATAGARPRRGHLASSPSSAAGASALVAEARWRRRPLRIEPPSSSLGSQTSALVTGR